MFEYFVGSLAEIIKKSVRSGAWDGRVLDIIEEL